VGKVWVVSAVLLLGCAEPADLTEPKDTVVTAETTKFIVYQQGEQVLAVYQGRQNAPTVNLIERGAIRAVEQSFGCPIDKDRVQVSGTMMVGYLNCAHRNSLFLRARAKTRGRSARSGAGLPDDTIFNADQGSVAQE
jgi:hypothetical protein